MTFTGIEAILCRYFMFYAPLFFLCFICVSHTKSVILPNKVIIMAQREDKEKQKVSRETTGKFFYDLAKASFTTMVIGSMASFFSDSIVFWKPICLLCSGIFLTVFLALIGNKILKS